MNTTKKIWFSVLWSVNSNMKSPSIKQTKKCFRYVAVCFDVRDQQPIQFEGNSRNERLTEKHISMKKREKN